MQHVNNNNNNTTTTNNNDDDDDDDDDSHQSVFCDFTVSITVPQRVRVKLILYCAFFDFKPVYRNELQENFVLFYLGSNSFLYTSLLAGL